MGIIFGLTVAVAIVLSVAQKFKNRPSPPQPTTNPPVAGAGAPAPGAPATPGTTPAAGATPAPTTPATTPPPPTGPLYWVGAVGAITLMVFLLPWDWTSSIFGSGIFWRIAGAIGLYALVSGLLFQRDVTEETRGYIMTVAFILMIMVIISQFNLDVSGCSTSRPVPEIIWRETKIVEAPAKVSWDKATEVQLPWAISKWGIYSLTEPPEDGSEYLEIFARGWYEPFRVKGEESFRLPTLPGDRKVKLRSLTEEPLKIEVRWR